MMAVLHIHTENHDALLKFYSVHVHARPTYTVYTLWIHKWLISTYLCTCTDKNKYSFIFKCATNTLNRPYFLETTCMHYHLQMLTKQLVNHTLCY